MALSYHKESDYCIYKYINNILPRDLVCGAKYVKRRKKIRGETLCQNQPISHVQAVWKFIWLSGLVNKQGSRNKQTGILLEKVFDKLVIGQNQLLGLWMRLALEGDQVDKSILIPGRRQLHFYDLPALVQSGKQEHITIGKVGGAARFLESIPDILHASQRSGRKHILILSWSGIVISFGRGA
jgi:hypothetical protein